MYVCRTAAAVRWGAGLRARRVYTYRVDILCTCAHTLCSYIRACDALSVEIREPTALQVGQLHAPLRWRMGRHSAETVRRE